MSVATGFDLKLGGEKYHPNIKQGMMGRHLRYLTETTEKKPVIDDAPLTNLHADELQFAGMDKATYRRAIQVAIMKDPNLMK